MIEMQELGPGAIKQTFGGDTLNTAIYCARLADSLPLKVDYVTAVGCDSFSEKMVRFWEQEGVGSNLVQMIAGERPGLYFIELDSFGERVFHYWRSDAAARKCFEYPGSEKILQQFSEYEAIYLSGISLAILTETSRSALIERLEELSKNGISIFFDCNYRSNLWESVSQATRFYEELYRISEIVFLTTEEVNILFDGDTRYEAHNRLKEFGVMESVIKDGGRPCSIFTNEDIIEVPAKPVDQVVDTTAAGDSFSAVYMVARSFGCSPCDAAKMAHAIAAYVIRHKGAMAPVEDMPITGQDIVDCRPM